MRARIKVIANPISGRGRGARLARELVLRLQERGCTVDLRETRAAGDARRFAGDVEGFETVACIGGDGTVNEVLNGLPASGSPPLGMVPCGTANVLAKELGLPRGVAGLAGLLTEGRVRRWDLGADRVSGRRFLLFASAGYDATVVRVFHQARRGPIRMRQYVLWGLKTVLHYRVPRITVELDGRVLSREAAWVQVSNVASYGGPLVFTPRARPDDGAFEVMVHHGRRKRDVVRMFWAGLLNYLLGLEARMADVTFHTARRVGLTSTDGLPVPVQLDGDPAGHLPVDLEILPGGIGVLAP